ncbi:hypothetical protein BGX33_012195 [Mortierella sp. NVP41]|nr:hypothetical protein BGX33_012195 [Mortierella sp. NVP41]
MAGQIQDDRDREREYRDREREYRDREREYRYGHGPRRRFREKEYLSDEGEEEEAADEDDEETDESEDDDEEMRSQEEGIVDKDEENGKAVSDKADNDESQKDEEGAEDVEEHEDIMPRRGMRNRQPTVKPTKESSVNSNEHSNNDEREEDDYDEYNGDDGDGDDEEAKYEEEEEVAPIRDVRRHQTIFKSDTEPPFDLDGLSDEIAALHRQIPNERLKAFLSHYEVTPQSTTLKQIWKEWFSAVSKKPSIWSLNRYYRIWRVGGPVREPKQSQVQVSMPSELYRMKRLIVQEVLKEIAAARLRSQAQERQQGRTIGRQGRTGREGEKTLANLVDEAHEIVQAGIDEARSLSLFYKRPDTRRPC